MNFTLFSRGIFKTYPQFSLFLLIQIVTCFQWYFTTHVNFGN